MPSASRLSRKPTATELKSPPVVGVGGTSNFRGRKLPSLTGRPTWPAAFTAVNHAPMNPENGLAPGQSIRGCIADNGGVRFPGPHNRLRSARLLLLRASHALDPARLLLPRPLFPPSTPQAAPTQFRH